MKSNQGIIDLRTAIQKISDGSVRRDKGIGVLDTATIDANYRMSLPGLATLLEPNQYYVSSSLLSHECDTTWSGPGVSNVTATVKNRFSPGNYLILYINSSPVVISKLTKGDEAIGG